MFQELPDTHYDAAWIQFPNHLSALNDEAGKWYYVVKIDSYFVPNVRTNGSSLFQRQRFANLAKFKSNVFKILVATDVAARYRKHFSTHLTNSCNLFAFF